VGFDAKLMSANILFNCRFSSSNSLNRFMSLAVIPPYLAFQLKYVDPDRILTTYLSHGASLLNLFQYSKHLRLTKLAPFSSPGLLSVILSAGYSNFQWYYLGCLQDD